MRRSVGASIVGLLVGLEAGATTVVGIEEPGCALGNGITASTGLALRPGVGFVVVDATTDEVYTFDQDCALVGASFDTAGFGATDPNGIAWDPVNSQLAIVDNVDDEVYFRTATGASVGQCDLAALGATGAVGIAYNSRTGLYAVVDNVQDKVYTIDDNVLGGASCTFVSQFSTTPFGSAAAVDISYKVSTDQYLIPDSSTGEVYYTTTGGVLIDSMDTSDFSSPQGLVYEPLSQRLYLVDTNDNLIPVDARGTLTPGCSTAAQGSTDATGIGLNTATGDIAFVDEVDERIYVVNPLTCAPVAQILTGAAGAIDPQDVAYVDLTNEYVVADDSFRLYFFDATTGASTSVCDLPTGMSTEGLDYLPELDLLAVTAYDDDSWVLVDTSCQPVHVRGLGPYYAGVMLLDVAYHRGTGTFVLVEGGIEDLSVMSFEGTQVRRFDVGGSGLQNMQGLVAIPGDRDGFYILDQTLDEIRRLDIPALGDTSSLSGRYTSASSTLYLWDRGEGRVTGTAIVGGSTLPVFGEFDGSTGSLSIGAVTGAGNVVAFPITVSADLDTINAPPPVGTLTRAY